MSFYLQEMFFDTQLMENGDHGDLGVNVTEIAAPDLSQGAENATTQHHKEVENHAKDQTHKRENATSKSTAQVCKTTQHKWKNFLFDCIIADSQKGSPYIYYLKTIFQY